MADTVMRSEAAALYLGVSKATLNSWYQGRIGPAFSNPPTGPTGKRIRLYRKSDLDAWLDKSRVETRPPKKQAKGLWQWKPAVPVWRLPEELREAFHAAVAREGRRSAVQGAMPPVACLEAFVHRAVTGLSLADVAAAVPDLFPRGKVDEIACHIRVRGWALRGLWPAVAAVLAEDPTCPVRLMEMLVVQCRAIRGIAGTKPPPVVVAAYERGKPGGAGAPIIFRGRRLENP